MTCRLDSKRMCAHGERHGRPPRSPGPLSAACTRNATAPISVASRAEGGRSRPETMTAHAAWLGGVSCTCQHQQGMSESPERERGERRHGHAHGRCGRFERSRAPSMLLLLLLLLPPLLLLLLAGWLGANTLLRSSASARGAAGAVTYTR